MPSKQMGYFDVDSLFAWGQKKSRDRFWPQVQGDRVCLGKRPRLLITGLCGKLRSHWPEWEPFPSNKVQDAASQALISPFQNRMFIPWARCARTAAPARQPALFWLSGYW